MDPVSGIRPVGMPVASTSTGENPDAVSMVGVKLMLDAQKTAGQAIVKMLENLGNTIDTYA